MPRSRWPVARYVSAAKGAVLDLLRSEHAATWAEIQAKVGDRPWNDTLPAIDPHHLTTARHQLTAEHLITESFGAYRGRSIGVMHLTDLSRRQTALSTSAARKRRLTARFLDWAASTSRFRSGLIGAGGEAVVHASLISAAPNGYRVIRPEGGDVRSLLGEPVASGPLDNAAFLNRLDSNGIPLSPILVAIEVKNVRHWLYPNAQEIYQLLYKAARLRQRSGGIDVLPVLVCRRRHYLTYEFSRALGFVAFETLRQFIHPGAPIAETKLDEVRVELGFRDLTVSSDPYPDIVRLFADTLPRLGGRIAAQWRDAGSKLVER